MGSPGYNLERLPFHDEDFRVHRERKVVLEFPRKVIGNDDIPQELGALLSQVDLSQHRHCRAQIVAWRGQINTGNEEVGLMELILISSPAGHSSTSPGYQSFPSPVHTYGVLLADVVHEFHEANGDALLIHCLPLGDACPLPSWVQSLLICCFLAIIESQK